MLDNAYAVIMAGGGGTRLWPLSRHAQPKQMLKLGSDYSLFQIAIQRLKGLFTPDHILVVTVADQAHLLQQQVPEIPIENYLLEPLPRGTASVVGLAAAALRKRNPNASMVILTADHFIQNVPLFQQVLLSALKVADQDYLVTLGIKPTFASTGYGYVQRGQKLAIDVGMPVYTVKRFTEKPNEETANRFIAGGEHDWNSGMFIWRAEVIWRAFERLMPELFNSLVRISDAWGTPEQSQILQELWPGIHPETIDYGIMEKAERVAVIPAADLNWNDVGSWESLFDVLPPDENGNIILKAQHVGLDTHSSLIYCEDPGRLVVTIGAKDLIVVDTGDAVLVCPRHEAQKIRELVNLLKKSGYERYL